MAMSTLRYLKQELDFTISEWQELSDQDKEELREYAREEMEANGIEVD